MTPEAFNTFFSICIGFALAGALVNGYQALAQRPALLLCDEPTGQLDSDTGNRVLDLIAALHERIGFALAIATHDPDVAAHADRVVTLEDGRVVSDEKLNSSWSMMSGTFFLMTLRAAGVLA